MMNGAAHPKSTLWLISQRWDLAILAILTIGGCLLRAIGIPHGIGYHPDERHMVMVTEALANNGMNPRSFAYGSFSFYSAWAFSQMLRPFWEFAGTYDGLFFSGRIFCTLMGTITIALSYYLAILLYKRSLVGLIAAFLMACNVFHLQLSRYFTADITLTTLCLISVIALVQAHQRGTLGSFLVFGACAGLATATKIASVFLASPLLIVIGLAIIKEWPRVDATVRFLKVIGIILGGLILLGVASFLIHWKGYPKILNYRVVQEAFIIPLSIPFLLAISVLVRRHSPAISKLFACLAIGVVVFVLAEPFAILDFNTFTRQTAEQTAMVRGLWRPPYTIQYEDTVPYFYHLKQMLWYTMGWPVFSIVAVGLLAASVRVLIDLLDKIMRRELATRSLSPEMIPLVFVAVFFLATGYFQVKFPRYLLPLYPMLFAFAASLFAFAVKSRPGIPIRREKLVSSTSLIVPVEAPGPTSNEQPLSENQLTEPISESEKPKSE